MPGPILDLGFDDALGRGLALGLHARQMEDARLYNDGRLAHQADADLLARERAENSLYAAQERADIADRSRDLADAQFAAKRDDSDRKRAARHQYASGLYDLAHGGEPEPEMGPFAEDQAPASQLYHQERDQYGTIAEDLDSGALLEQAKAARGQARILQLDKQIEGFERINPTMFPGGQEAYDRHHTALWMEREGLKGSVNSILGPAGMDRRMDQQDRALDQRDTSIAGVASRFAESMGFKRERAGVADEHFDQGMALRQAAVDLQERAMNARMPGEADAVAAEAKVHAQKARDEFMRESSAFGTVVRSAPLNKAGRDMIAAARERMNHARETYDALSNLAASSAGAAVRDKAKRSAPAPAAPVPVQRPQAAAPQPAGTPGLDLDLLDAIEAEMTRANPAQPPTPEQVSAEYRRRKGQP